MASSFLLKLAVSHVLYIVDSSSAKKVALFKITTYKADSRHSHNQRVVGMLFTLGGIGEGGAVVVVTNAVPGSAYFTNISIYTKPSFRYDM